MNLPKILSSLLAVSGLAVICVGPSHARAATPTLTTLVIFCENCGEGEIPFAGLIADSDGNLFGTTFGGGAYGFGTVFEVVKTAAGYASVPTTLVSFNGTDGANPQGELMADADGNLFGTTSNGGASHAGTVFEVVKTATGYASVPTTLVNFNGANGSQPASALIAVADGNLLGTTSSGGVNGNGTVFEIAKRASGYAGVPTTLVNFNGANGAQPYSRLMADADGNLFGTTLNCGANGNGTVFEIAKRASGYASVPTTLVDFNGANGATPRAGVTVDADGNLFGTTFGGGAYGLGTVYEIPKSVHGYAGTPTTLVSFSGADGEKPLAGVIADASGSLFGTAEGGAYAWGTVFEIAKTAGIYANTATVLVSFNGIDGGFPFGGVIADANGNLFGTTSSSIGALNGTVFEITGSGFVPPPKFAGTPGKPNCIGQSVSALAKQYGGLKAAAAALGYSSVPVLLIDITGYCVA